MADAVPKSRLSLLMESVEWEETVVTGGAGLVVVTHSGVMRIGQWKIRCYRLSDGREAVDLRDTDLFLEGGQGGR